MYEIVRDMNREIQARARVFLGCSVQSVFHTGDEIPEGTTRLKELPPRFLEFDTQGKGALVSNISNKGKRYVIVQNTSVKEDLPIRITTDNMVKMILRDGAEEYAYKYGPLFIIPKGDVLVFEIL